MSSTIISQVTASSAVHSSVQYAAQIDLSTLAGSTPKPKTTLTLIEDTHFDTSNLMGNDLSESLLVSILALVIIMFVARRNVS